MGGNDFLNALATAPNGSFYGVGGRDVGGGFSTFSAAHYQSNGLLATDWPAGKVFVNYGSSSSAWAVDVRDDGQVAVAGCFGSGIGWVQYAAGSSTVVASGSVDLPGEGECAYAVRFVGSSQLLVAGYQDLNGNQDIALARFLTVPSAVSDAGQAPGPSASIQLRAPFPNPLRQRSAITFDLPQSVPVQLSLHDVTGRLVRRIADETLAAGPHQFVWDGTDENGRQVADGMYFVRLDAGRERARATVVVLH
jgi:hypothetical protein